MPSRSVPDAGPAKTSDATIIGGVVCVIGLVIAVGVWYPTIERHEREEAFAVKVAAAKAREAAQENHDLQMRIASYAEDEKSQIEAQKRRLGAPLLHVWELASALPPITYPADRQARLAYINELNGTLTTIQYSTGINEEDKPLVDAVSAQLKKGYTALQRCDEDMLYDSRQEKAVRDLAAVLVEIHESLPKALAALNERAQEKMK